ARAGGGGVDDDVLGAAAEGGADRGLVLGGDAQEVGDRADHARDARGERRARALRVAAPRLVGGAEALGGTLRRHRLGGRERLPLVDRGQLLPRALEGGRCRVAGAPCRLGGGLEGREVVALDRALG